MSLPPHLSFPIVSSPGLSRRAFITRTGSLAAAALLASCANPIARTGVSFTDYPFQLGVASGDPWPDGFVLWTRLAPRPVEGGGMSQEPVAVFWEVAEDEGMRRVVLKGKQIAQPEWAHSVHVEVRGLRPNRWYWYRFKAGSDVSAIGRTRTLPVASALPDRLRFAFASCQHYEYGLYTAYDHMAREDLDLIVHLGDYIYEYGVGQKRPRQHNSAEIFTLQEYRNRYGLYKSDRSLQAAHALAPWLVTTDDHEVANNYAADLSEKPTVSRADLLIRRAAAYQAFYEHMPLRRISLPTGPDMLLFRSIDYGRLARFHVLDTRQYRTPQPAGKDGRKYPPQPDAMDPTATLLGGKQRDWLLAGLDSSSAVWNVLAQQVMMARVDRVVGPEVAPSMDQWPGYESERRALLRHFHSRKTSNPVVLTGDIHTNWANELLLDFDHPDSPVVGTEFVGTSISSGGNGVEAPATLDQLLSENPCVKFHNTERGYVSCDLTPKSWTAHYRTVSYIDRPGAPLNTRATFQVEPGRPGLNRLT